MTRFHRHTLSRVEGGYGIVVSLLLDDAYNNKYYFNLWNQRVLCGGTIPCVHQNMLHKKVVRIRKIPDLQQS